MGITGSKNPVVLPVFQTALAETQRSCQNCKNVCQLCLPECPFDAQSDLILRMIFSYLNVKDKKNARLTCKRWSQECGKMMKFRILLNENPSEIAALKLFGDKGFSISKIIVQKATGFCYKPEWKFTNVEELILDEKDEGRDNSERQWDLDPLLKAIAPNLRCLTLTNHAQVVITCPRSLSDVNFPNLAELKFGFIREMEDGN